MAWQFPPEDATRPASLEERVVMLAAMLRRFSPYQETPDGWLEEKIEARLRSDAAGATEEWLADLAEQATEAA
jgi:hypothetical protein